LPAAGRFRFCQRRSADHENVFGGNVFAHLFGELLASPAIADGDRDGALGIGLADDVFVQFGDDLFWSQRLHRSIVWAASLVGCSVTKWTEHPNRRGSVSQE